MKYFKPILCIHIAASILGAILLLAVPFEDKLRWNMGYAVSWTVFLSALVVSCRIPSAIKFRKLLKAYLVVFWSLPVAGLCCMGFYAFYFPFLIKGTFVPSATIVGNKQYIIRETPFDVRMRGDCLYRKDGLLEVYIGDIGCREQEGEDTYISPVHLSDDMEIQSLDVSLAANTVTITCTDTVLTYKIMKQP